ncbi:MAG: peptidoglycan editing factor PgeF [Pseudomonadota bacterium]
MADFTDTPFEITHSPALAGVPHGFFASPDPTANGLSQMGYGGPGETGAIRDLRSRAAGQIVAGAALLAPHQVHSPDVVIVGRGAHGTWPDEQSGRPVADAVVTAQPGLVLGVVTADCGPVLLADKAAGVVGAAHAGWRGARGGVLENTIAAMMALGARPTRIVAVLGPTISMENYEVDAAFREHFSQVDEPHFEPAPMRENVARWHFDLPGYILARLKRSGVAEAIDLGHDTYAMEGVYFSYRRASQRGEPNYGRQLSAIAVPD